MLSRGGGSKNGLYVGGKKYYHPPHAFAYPLPIYGKPGKARGLLEMDRDLAHYQMRPTFVTVTLLLNSALTYFAGYK